MFSGFTSYSSSEIIDRAKNILKIKTDTELGNLLNVSQSTVASWRKRNNLDLSILLTKISGVNVHYLVTGEGEPFFKNNIIYEPGTEYGNLSDPLAIIEKLKSLDPAHLKTIIELIDMYSKNKK